MIALLPEGKLFDVVFLAQMKTVIGQKHDKGVVLVRALVQRIDNSSKLCIYISCGRQVRPHGVLVKPMLHHTIDKTTLAVR